MAKDVVFPTRPLRRQLTQARQRLRDMQDELELVKEQEARERRRSKRRRYVVSQILARDGLLAHSAGASRFTWWVT